MKGLLDLRGRQLPNPIVALAIAVMVGFALVAILAPLISPHPPNAQSLMLRLRPPGTEGYLLGTDQLGRDVLSRMIYGARISLSIGVIVMVLTAMVGVAIGLVSAYFGGWLDTIIMRIVDIWLAFPFLVLAIALVAVLGQGPDKIVLALVLSSWPGFARPVRGEVLQLREREYTLSARALGVSPFGIMFKHLLPNIMPTILVLSAIDLGYNILALASLSFLGLGMGAETATWGGMLSSGRNYVATSWWLAAFPGVAIFLVVMSSNLIGDWIRDIYDPRSPFRAARNQAAGEARAARDAAAEPNV
ncbi:ABC transporter permease [Maritimibacter sp. HL-12]|uniref:ABC transporter permease n=1 Tax=Maritimibacter sp. HL-12 TaxID=1162418 RepID=UPI000A0EF000|nr:ABC transporter permease [Maritimibacter sp. HL-12]SMH28874.1 peptide/nickel transport system permease protein [Maritimibacter sp. HL-12]